jgi:phosphatidate cytidylyltransferase
MKIRIISGACFVAIITAFFLLREFVHPAFFNILIWFLCAFGTFEVVRALKQINSKFINGLAIVSGIILIPAYAILDYFLGINALLICISYLLITVIFYFAYSFIKFNEVPFFGLIPLVYPSILLLCMAGTNNLVYNGFIALLLIFVISPFTDTMAYFTGMVYNKIKKGNAKKLCPKLSPKKTQAGAIGGLVGGAIGGILVYLVFKPEISIGLPFIVFAVIGIVASILTQVGDLFESFIKRRVGLKDMGKIMPGHGGVMDRIDGITFASLFIYIIFLVI